MKTANACTSEHPACEFFSKTLSSASYQEVAVHTRSLFVRFCLTYAFNQRHYSLFAKDCPQHSTVENRRTSNTWPSDRNWAQVHKNLLEWISLYRARATLYTRAPKEWTSLLLKVIIFNKLQVITAVPIWGIHTTSRLWPNNLVA